MTEFDPAALQKLFIPSSGSHKGQNGKVLLIAGSKLFHAASIWPLTVISRMCDMVFYSSVVENNELVLNMKEQFLNGIVVPRENLDSYIEESECILIGPGMPREEGIRAEDDDTKVLTESLLKKYSTKKWVIDGGSLQTIDPEVLKNLETLPILTPHQKEFEKLFNTQLPSFNFQSSTNELNDQIQGSVGKFASEYNCVILLKGEKDIVCTPTECVTISGGNAGMTKGGTGDVLAGLTAAFYAKNGAFLSACAASYINKKAGDSLFAKVGYYFNASDLADEIPKILAEITTR